MRNQYQQQPLLPVIRAWRLDGLRPGRFETEALVFRAELHRIAGRRAEAVANAEEAVKISRETGPAFLGPFALGALALASEDPTARQAALAEGEALLEAGAVSHNHLLFRRDAIDAYLGAGDWEGVERSAAGLAQYTRRSPCRSAIFTVRLRALWHHAVAVSRTQLPSQQSSSISAKRASGSVCRSRCLKL